jgi:hypothetical protein
MSNESTAWESYEEVAAYLLDQIANEFGLERIEGKQKVLGKRSGREWEIDAKGLGEGNELFFIVECRRYTTSRLNQEELGALAYRIIDSGARGGIIVSSLGLQEGAVKLAAAENIHEVILDQNSTRTEYLLKFLGKIRAGKGLQGALTSTGSLSMTIIRKDGAIEELGEQN